MTSNCLLIPAKAGIYSNCSGVLVCPRIKSEGENGEKSIRYQRPRVHEQIAAYISVDGDRHFIEITDITQAQAFRFDPGDHYSPFGYL